jgi:hypothetical protein
MEPSPFCFICDWYRRKIRKLVTGNNPRAMYWEDKLGEHLAWHAQLVTP